MHYGFVIPGGNVNLVAELAAEVEAAGWDGVFIPDCIWIDGADVGFDPWVALAAMALRTTRVRLGAMVTAVSRRRPWKLARETATLDHLSQGRLIFMAGLGALDDGGFGKVGEATARRTRSELLDEGLAIMTGLWSGQPSHFDGQHYHVEEMTFSPPPIQSPRIPIWIVGAWPRPKSMERALRYDGVIPAKMEADGSFGEMTPDDIRSMREAISAERGTDVPYAIIVEGQTPGDDPAQAATEIRPFADAGATWWMETMWSPPNDAAAVRARIRQGPPRQAVGA